MNYCFLHVFRNTVIIEWLLEGPEWVRYGVMVDLLGYEENHSEVIKARKEMVKDEQIKELLEELKEWPGKAIKSHKDATLLRHKLNFLIEVGLKDEPVIQEIKKKILAQQSEEGAFEVNINIRKFYGGIGCPYPTSVKVFLKNPFFLFNFFFSNYLISVNSFKLSWC